MNHLYRYAVPFITSLAMFGAAIALTLSTPAHAKSVKPQAAGCSGEGNIENLYPNRLLEVRGMGGTILVDANADTIVTVQPAALSFQIGQIVSWRGDWVGSTCRAQKVVVMQPVLAYTQNPQCNNGLCVDLVNDQGVPLNVTLGRQLPQINVRVGSEQFAGVEGQHYNLSCTTTGTRTSCWTALFVPATVGRHSLSGSITWNVNQVCTDMCRDVVTVDIGSLLVRNN